MSTLWMRLFQVMIFCVGLGASFLYYNHPPQKVVHVYNWYAMIPPDVMDDFKRETGINVVIDYYDSNDMLEAKLFAGYSGYDVVFPSASPYFSNQVKAGIYQPLQKDKLSHWHDLEPVLVEQIHAVDPGNVYGVPYFWGTLGFAYNEDMVKKCMLNAPIDSYAMLFDPNVVKHFEKCGVTYLEESIDVYPLVLMYLGKDLKSTDSQDLRDAQKHMLHLRPFIRRFSSSRVVSELVSGETCLAQTWSGDTHLAIQEAKKFGKTIHYVIPKEGTTLWIDSMAIPKDAPHPMEAHIFINFMMRPDICARVSQYTLLATATQSAKKHLPKAFIQDESIFPKHDVMQRLTLDQGQNEDYERERNRLWMNFRLNLN